MTDNNLLAFITTKIIKFLSQNYDYYLKAPNISRKLITFHIKNKAKQSPIAIQSTFSPPFRHEFPHPIHPSSTQSLPPPPSSKSTLRHTPPPIHPARRSDPPSKLHQSTQHAASSHAPCSIASRSTLHRLTLHGASAHAPRSVNPPYSKSMFPPRVEGPSRPYSPSRPVCCDAIATCPRFSSTFRLLSDPS